MPSVQLRELVRLSVPMPCDLFMGIVAMVRDYYPLAEVIDSDDPATVVIGVQP